MNILILVFFLFFSDNVSSDESFVLDHKSQDAEDGLFPQWSSDPGPAGGRAAATEQTQRLRLPRPLLRHQADLVRQLVYTNNT